MIDPTKRDEENLRKLIREHGFGEFEEMLMQRARPSIRVETSPVADESDLAIGQSKMGGRPDLPADIEWVQVSNGEKLESLPFIAQINLSDVAPYDAEQLLPNEGILYFFGDPWRGTYTNRGHIIYYQGQTEKLERRLFPNDLRPTLAFAPATDRFRPCSVEFKGEVNLSGNMAEAFSLDMSMRHRYESLVQASSYADSDLPIPSDVNRLLGNSFGISDLQLECELIAQTGFPHNVSQEKHDLASSTKSKWQLLFQVSSDENANMLWGDMGAICYYIREQDLAVQNFSDVCLAWYGT